MNRMLFSLLAAIALGFSNLSLANEDSDLKIKSSVQDLNYKNNTMYFAGEVIVSQGSISINADELFVETKDGAGDKLVAKGKPAKFIQKDATNGDLTAKADVVEYYVESQILKLLGNAHFQQGGSEVKSGNIEFDLAAQRVKADGDEATGGRVTTTIKTKKKSDPE